MSTWSLPNSPSRTSDCELAYASPKTTTASGAEEETVLRQLKKQKNLERALRDEEDKLGPDGRRRRLHRSSNDECHLTEDGLLNEDLRVGGPYLCSILLETITLTPDNRYYEIIGDRLALLQAILDISNHHQLRPEAIEIVGRGSKVHPEPHPVPTVYIMASRRELDDRWITACREIRALLIERGLETFSVEIADFQIFRPLKTFPIKSTQAIVAVWTAVLGSIMDVVDFDHVNMVGCYRRGAGWYAVENPPTVVVLVANAQYSRLEGDKGVDCTDS